MSISQPKNFRLTAIKALKNEIYRLPALQSIPTASSSRQLAASATHFAVTHGTKGSLFVLPLDYSSYTKKEDVGTNIAAHGGEVMDWSFSPFHDDILATSGSDGIGKVWKFSASPSSAASISTPVSRTENLDSVSSLQWHPTVDHTIAFGYKNGVCISNVEREASETLYLFSHDGYSKDCISLGWNFNGTLLASLSKTNTVAVFDPRSAAANVLQEGTSSNTVKKPQHVMYVGNESAEYLTLFGLSAGFRPLVQFFDPRSVATPILQYDFDFSQGFTLPMYDADTQLLYFTVRGSNMISMFDIEAVKGKPSVIPVHTYSCDTSIKAATLINKRGVNVLESEVGRMLIAGTDTVEPLSARVPRKVAGFHDSLYPPTRSLTPAIGADEWKSGGNSSPNLFTMGASVAENINATPSRNVAQPESNSNGSSSPTSNSTSAVPAASSNHTQTNGNNKVLQPSARAASVSYVPTNARSNLDQLFKKSAFVHTSFVEPPSQHDTYFDLRLSPTTLSLAENIRSNDTFFAFVWQVSGGSGVAVLKMGKLGRLPFSPPLVKGHANQVSAFDLSPREPHQLATASIDGDVRIVNIPADGVTKEITAADQQFQLPGKVTFLRYHPYVNDLLICASSSFEGHKLEMVQVSTGATKWSVDFHTDAILDVSVHPHGHKFATTCKDGKVRIIDVASRLVLQEFSPPENVRDTRVLWINDNRILTSGFAPASMRSMSLFDLANTTSPLATVELDRNNAIPIPRYDEDTHLLFVAHYGGSFEHLYEMRDDAPYFELLNTFQTSKDALGMVFLSKFAVNVRRAEILRALKLTKDSVQPVSHTIPRKRVQFFQDDLYPPTRANVPLFTIDEYFTDSIKNGKKPELVSLQPMNMIPLSSAPPEEMTDRQKRYSEQISRSAVPEAKGVLGTQDQVSSHFRALASTASGANRWDAKVDNSQVDVDESEWD